jgi:tetratricopeptide (TPR) repeat protein
MKKVLFITSLIALGFVLGVLIMGYLSKRASSTFLEIIKLNYITEQEVHAVRAKFNGDLDQAALYYKNIISAQDPPGLRSFDPYLSSWDFAFPFAAPILRKMQEVAPRRGGEALYGITHGKLAYVLEKMGKKEEAEQQYLMALEMIGRSSNGEWVKEFVEQLNSIDTLTLKLEGIFTYPEKLD